MRHAPHLALAAITASLGLAACDDGSPTLDGAPLSAPAPRDVAPVPGGGTSGGPLNGVLTVFVVDPEDRPIPGATIVVDGEGVTTDDAGRVDLSRSDLTGRVDVHVFAPGHPHHSSFEVPSSVLTVALEPAFGPTDRAARGVATISGVIEGWHRLPAPTAGLARVVEVEAFGPGPLELLEQPRRSGSATPDDPDGMPSNIAVDGAPPFPSWRDYTLRAETRAVGLVAYASTFDADRTPGFVRTHLGLRLGLDLDDGEIVDEVEVLLTHELDTRLSVQGPATALERRRATFGLDLGEGRVVPLDRGPLDARFGRRAIAPSLHGELAEALYFAAIHLRSTEEVAGAPAREILAARSSRLPELDLQDALSAPPSPSLADRTLAAPLPAEADLGRIRIRDADGHLRWEVWTHGTGRSSFVLPPVPEDASDLPRGRTYLESSAFDLGPDGATSVALAEARPESEAHHRVVVER